MTGGGPAEISKRFVTNISVAFHRKTALNKQLRKADKYDQKLCVISIAVLVSNIRKSAEKFSS